MAKKKSSKQGRSKKAQAPAPKAAKVQAPAPAAEIPESPVGAGEAPAAEAPEGSAEAGETSTAKKSKGRAGSGKTPAKRGKAVKSSAKAGSAAGAAPERPVDAGEAPGAEAPEGSAEAGETSTAKKSKGRAGSGKTPAKKGKAAKGSAKAGPAAEAAPERPVDAGEAPGAEAPEGSAEAGETSAAKKSKGRAGAGSPLAGAVLASFGLAAKALRRKWGKAGEGLVKKVPVDKEPANAGSTGAVCEVRAQDARRNGITAAAFLLALGWAVLFLFLGVLPKAGGFLEAAHPGHGDQTALVSLQALTDPDYKAPRAPAVHVKAMPERDIRGELPAGAALPDLEEVLEALPEDQARIDASEKTLIDLLDRDHQFIEVYGLAQRLALREVVEDAADPQYTVVKLTDTMLTFANLEPKQTDMTTRAKEFSNFARRVERRFDIPVVYVQAPSKLSIGEPPTGVVDYGEAEADQFISLVEEAGAAEVIDLRPAFSSEAEKDPDALEKLFFHTDHHWTPAGAFLGYQTLMDELSRLPACRRLFRNGEEEWTDEDSYKKYTFHDVFLGSQGKRVGSAYAGTDDLEVWVPRFDTDFSVVVNESATRKGPFAVSLLYPELLAQEGLYDTNPYVVYSGGDFLLSRIENKLNPDGPKVLILRESFGCAFTPFLSLSCSQLFAIDPRSFRGDRQDMLNYIAWLDPDVVLVMNTTGSLKVDTLYPYLPTAKANLLAEEAAKKAQETQK